MSQLVDDAMARCQRKLRPYAYCAMQQVGNLDLVAALRPLSMASMRSKKVRGG